MNLLPDAEAFRRVVDGSDRSLRAGFLRAVLAAASAPYAAVVKARNVAYDQGLKSIEQPAVPVVSIGNLTLGGTGKTPLVAWVARHFQRRGLAVAIVSRGYGAKAGETSDEALELGILLPGVPHVADRDRVAAVRRAVESHGAGVVLLDDGFQHRRLARSLDIVTIDATDPFGGGRMFPRGLLREPVSSLARADAVVVTRSDMVDAESLAAIARTVGSKCRGRTPAVWVESCHGPTRLRTAAGETMPLEAIAGRRVAAVCGIGNPAPFRKTLERLGATIVTHVNYPDHHAYDEEDVRRILEAARRERAEWIVTTLKDLVKLRSERLGVTTLKDLVKLRSERLGECPLVAVEIELSITSGREPLERLLAGVPCAASS